MKKLFTIAFLGILLVMSSLMAGEITSKGAKTIDIYQLRKELVYVADHRLLGSAGISSATTYLTVTNTPVAVVNGGFVTLVATNTISFTSPTTTVAASKYCIFAVGINTSGEYVTKQSPVVTYGKDLVFPLLDEGTTTIGSLHIATDASTTFVPNTTSISTTGITATITNLSVPPVSLNVNSR